MANMEGNDDGQCAPSGDLRISVEAVHVHFVPSKVHHVSREEAMGRADH
jgi:hypothetical protein